MLNPEQRKLVENLNKKPTQEKCDLIADTCNKNNISIEQLKEIVNTLKK